MDKKKLLISGLTVAGFLASGTLSHLSFAGEEAKEAKKVEGKKGSCAGGSCGAMHDKDKKEPETKTTKAKEGSCSGIKDKEKKGEKEK